MLNKIKCKEIEQARDLYGNTYQLNIKYSVIVIW